MLRGVGRESGLALGDLLRAHPDFAVLAGDAVHDWLPAALRDPGSALSLWLRENGFVPAFTVQKMMYSGGPFPEPALPFSPYQDSDYPAVQELISRSFYDMRRAVGVTPEYIAPSPECRELFARCAGDLFTLRQGGRIIGFCTAMEHEVDDVCVDEGHRGQGLGAALVMRAVNHILQKGEAAVQLSVVDWNAGAYALYRKLGFTDLYTTFLFRKAE